MTSLQLKTAQNDRVMNAGECNEGCKALYGQHLRGTCADENQGHFPHGAGSLGRKREASYPTTFVQAMVIHGVDPSRSRRKDSNRVNPALEAAALS
ncbi:hypothetical protein ATY81_22170 [Rhizobium sp. R72]|uniref:hypothetical protein n=1 Tax=unclassified Rhizobium TaxID=2613769 RepID=UPI000B6EBAE0|nr:MULTISPECIES: hypothetical protein [unclassified Rhizobium]OWW02351.1 hypothetical protein ATY81_22170 [Rhizobium sp. R72]OWW02485.1 hypothetical protein ATY80_22170 [Rhizobium sp. R711]